MGRVLIVAGSDSGGGAGIQADLKTVAALGAYGMTAITALTAQNTQGVHGVHPVPPEFIAQQISVCLSDIGADAVKTGMLHSRAVIETVARSLDETEALLVVDPVMVAKGGHRLLESEAEEALISVLLPLCDLLTPNAPEAGVLVGQDITSTDDLKRAGDVLLEKGCGAVLLKGGHLPGDTVVDVLMSEDEIRTFSSPRIETRHTHGTGCTLASAVAALLARGESLGDAVETAREYVIEAIRAAPGLGQGHGPLGHMAPVFQARDEEGER